MKWKLPCFYVKGMNNQVDRYIINVTRMMFNYNMIMFSIFYTYNKWSDYENFANMYFWHS